MMGSSLDKRALKFLGEVETAAQRRDRWEVAARAKGMSLEEYEEYLSGPVGVGAAE